MGVEILGRRVFGKVRCVRQFVHHLRPSQEGATCDTVCSGMVNKRTAF